VLLPDEATLSEASLDFASIAEGSAPMEAAAAAAGGVVPLAGTLVWSDAELGWIATWRLPFGGEDHRWQIRGVSFDDAFRNALRGAAQVLSGNGEPG